MWANTLPFAPALFSNSDNSTEVRKSVFIDKRCCRLLATLSGFTFVNAPPADPPFVSFSSSKACCPCKLHTCSLFSLTAADYPSRATSPHDHRADHDAGEETLQLHQLGRYTTGGSAAFWIVHSLANATTRARNYVLVRRRLAVSPQGCLAFRKQLFQAIKPGAQQGRRAWYYSVRCVK